MNRKIFLGGILAVMLGTGMSALCASTYTYDFSNTFDGTSPAGAPPWIEATVSDKGANTVQLTLAAVNLAPNESVNCWYFNLNPALDATSLSFSPSSTSGSFVDPTVKTGVDAFKAGIDGKYDVLFTFAKAGGDSSLFGNGESITFTITGISGLSASDFDFLSAPGGGGGPYISAAHIVTGDQSGWVDPASLLHAHADTAPAVPDVSGTLALLTGSLASLSFLRKRIRA